MKNKFPIIVILFLLFLSGCGSSNEDIFEYTKSFFAMDTYITLTAYGNGAEKQLVNAQNEIERLEKLWSATDENSEIYAVNHSNGKTISVSAETSDLVRFSLETARKTNGALEPSIYPVLTAWGFATNQNRVPEQSEITELLKRTDFKKVSVNGNEITVPPDMMIDLGAVGKGYAADLTAELLRGGGVTSALLNLGGNVQTIGAKPDGNPWRLGIRDPFSGGTLGILEAVDLAVVTSGNYERYFVGEDGKTYGHIIDPKSGYPVDNGLMSVTVIAKEGKLCDALSTSLFVMGFDKAADFWRENHNFDMLIVTEDGKVYVTEGIRDAFRINDTYGMTLEVLE